MIKVDINETFPVLVSLVDETTGLLSSGKTVYYDIRYTNDASLSPPIAGTLTESSVESGVYRSNVSIPESGEFIIYATCSGFIANIEEIIVNPESIYDIAKQNRNYNIYVEDVLRENAVSTASQTARNVALGNTDYIITKIKEDSATTWSGTTTSGLVYAHYRSVSDTSPYKMGGPF